MNEIKLTPDQEKVLAYLINHESGTVREIQEAAGMTEVRSRISELKNKGFNFTSVYEIGPNKYGELKRYKRYRLRRTT